MLRGSVAQLVERTTENREVTGSTPVGATETLVRLLLTGVSSCPVRGYFRRVESNGSWLLGCSSILKGIDCGICAGKVPVASRHKWANFPALLDDVARGVDERRPMSATCHHLRPCAEHPNRKDRTILVAR